MALPKLTDAEKAKVEKVLKDVEALGVDALNHVKDAVAKMDTLSERFSEEIRSHFSGPGVPAAPKAAEDASKADAPKDADKK